MNVILDSTNNIIHNVNKLARNVWASVTLKIPFSLVAARMTKLLLTLTCGSNEDAVVDMDDRDRVRLCNRDARDDKLWIGALVW